MIDYEITWLHEPVADILDNLSQISYCENYCKEYTATECSVKCGKYY